MNFRQRLDRIWLWVIGIAFAIFLPLFTILWAQRLGWFNLTLVVLALFMAGLYRGWPRT